MSKFFSSIVFLFFILFQATAIADEGDIKPLLVPEAVIEVLTTEDSETMEESHEQEGDGEEVQTENHASEEESDIDSAHEEVQIGQINEESTTEEPVLEEPVVEAPSEDELEAQRAEEAEMREVGAGEEPVIEE